MIRRHSWKLDPMTGKPVVAEVQRRIIPPGPFAEVFTPPPISLMTGQNGRAVVLVVKVGDGGLPIPMSIEEAERHIANMQEAIAALREARCPAESPATAPEDCPQPAGIETTIAPCETERQPASTVLIAGGACGR